MSATAITHRNNVKVKGIGVISKAALLEDIDPDFSQVSELTVVESGTQNPIQHPKNQGFSVRSLKIFHQI